MCFRTTFLYKKQSRFVDLLSGKCLSAVFGEQKCDLILRSGEGERDAACCDFAGGEQKADALYGETVVFFALLPAQMCVTQFSLFDEDKK